MKKNYWRLYDWGYTFPSHTNVCNFFNFQLTFSQLIITPEMLKLGRVTKAKVFSLVLVYVLILTYLNIRPLFWRRVYQGRVRLRSIRSKNNWNNASKRLFGSFSHSGIPGFQFRLFYSQEQNSRNMIPEYIPE